MSDATGAFIKLLPELEAEWRKIELQLKTKFTEEDTKQSNVRYTKQKVTHDLPEYRSKVVRLDRAILACHLIAARYAFEEMPKVLTLLTYKFQHVLENFVGKAAAKRLLGRKVSGNLIVTALNEMLSFSSDVTTQGALEVRIRRISLQYRNNLGSIPFARRVHPRKTKLVFTRIPKKK